jgi:CRISPR/Cas system CSM-associated protein Csm3 (group 7 of RAMP superfamily)
MNEYNSLSKRERTYQFFYLFFMLLTALAVLSFLLLREFNSPFSETDTLELQMLSQKNKFAKQQNVVEPLLTTTYTKIDLLKPEELQPFTENDIKNSINDVANAFSNVDVYDPRKEAYLQIAQFYKMYFEDKKMVAKKTENIKLFEQQFEECSIGFKDKEQQLAQKKNAILSRSN